MQRTLLLDLDGTLVDSVPDLAAALNAVMAASGLAPFTRPEVARMVGDGVDVLLARAFAARHQPQGATARPLFMEVYGANIAAGTHVYPGVPEGMRALAEAGWALAVCTNKPEALARSLLDAVGLTPMLAAIGGGDSFPTRKPDPAHLLATLAQAGGVKAEALMVGDHGNDVKSAAGAGIPCIFASWGYGPREEGRAAAAIAESFADVPVLAARLLPAPLRG